VIGITEQSAQSDDQLVRDARNGDFEAFRRIVLRYSNALLSVAYGILGDFHEAQDVAQEAFVKGYRNLHTLQDTSRLGSWLYSIAYRTSLDFAKKKKQTLPYDESLTDHSDDAPTWLDRHATQEAMNAALRTLEEKSRTAVILYYLNDWTMKEIGRFLQLSASAVESRIRRAKESLRRSLADDFAAYFRPYRLGSDFERTVSEQVLRKMGHFYIPVTDRRQTTDWFVRHFCLGISEHGNLLLESGHELYMLECSSFAPGAIPVLTFTVSDAEALWTRLQSDGVSTLPIGMNEWFGIQFVFFDPDGNSYCAVEHA